MKPYSNDLRRRIVEAYEANEYTQQQVANLFGVSQATVKNLVRRKRDTGSTDALPHAGGKKPLLNDKARTYIQHVITQTNDLTLAELCQRVKGRHKKKVSRPTMSRVLQTLGLPRKKSRSTPAKEIPQESNSRARSINKKSAS